MKEGVRIGEQYARRLTYVIVAVWLVQVSGIGLLAYWVPALRGGICVWLLLLLCVGLIGSVAGVRSPFR